MALLAQAGGLVIWLWTDSGGWTLCAEGAIFLAGIWIIAPHLSPERVRQPVPQSGAQATLAWILLGVATLAMLAAAVAIATDVERSARSMALGFLAEFPTAAVAIGGYMLLSPRIVAEGARPDRRKLRRFAPAFCWLAAVAMAASACFQAIGPHPLDRPFPQDLATYTLAAGAALMVAAAVEAARRMRPVSSPNA